MRILELFSGTGSVGAVFKAHGHDVVSLDRDMPADIRTDIMDWDYRMFPSRHFDFIWASPPCTEYSKAKTMGARKIEMANEIVKRTLEIVQYYDPKHWMIENPQTGLLKDQPFMRELPYRDIDYCKYGMPYRKRTRLWGNLDCWQPRPLCKRDCGSMNDVGKKHRETAQRMPHGTKEQWTSQAHHRREELYRVPSELVREIMEAIDSDRNNI